VRIDSGQKQALAFLVQQIRPESPIEFRLHALRTLKWLGPAARAAAPPVRTLLDDPNQKVRQAAAATLPQLVRPARIT
jgi:hypothetical protein